MSTQRVYTSRACSGRRSWCWQAVRRTRRRGGSPTPPVARSSLRRPRVSWLASQSERCALHLLNSSPKATTITIPAAHDLDAIDTVVRRPHRRPRRPCVTARFEVVWTDTSFEELLGIVDYIADRQRRRRRARVRRDRRRCTCWTADATSPNSSSNAPPRPSPDAQHATARPRGRPVSTPSPYGDGMVGSSR